MKKFNDLYEFVDRATKSRKYPENTAGALKAALKLFEKELNEEERNSIDKLKNNINQIYNSVVSKNGKTFSISSLSTYKSRVLKVINDYEKYGVDPTKMGNWSPKIITRSSKKLSTSNAPSSDEEMLYGQGQIAILAGTNKFELTLGPGRKCVIIVPVDTTQEEGKKIKAILDSLY